MKPIYWVRRVFPTPLETPEQNYWLGLLMADGYLQRAGKSSCSLVLELSAKDGYLVSKFADFIEVKPHSRRKSVRALRNCTKELDILKKHGLVFKKTGQETYPKTVTDDWAFIRGVLDGEGSVGNYKKRSLSLSFVSQSKDFLFDIAFRLHQIGFNVPNLGTCGDRNASRISYTLGYDKAKVLYEKLYEYPFPRLHRKERIIRLFVDRPKPKIGSPTKAERLSADG